MVYENYRAALRRLQAPFDRHAHWRRVARTLQLSRQASQRLERMIWYEAHGRNASLTCRRFGISRKVFYGWRGRFDPANLRTLEDRSRAPHRKRRRTITPLQEEHIVALRRQFIRYGKEKLALRYREAYGEPISAWKVQKTIEKYRLYYSPRKAELTRQRRARAQRKKRITELVTRPFPGYLVALDAIVIYWGGLKRYILTAIDTTSKIAFARMYTAKSSRSAADFLRRLFWLLDGSVWNALSDNGSEFQGEFERACHELGIAHYWTRVRTPDDNAMSERFNRTLQEEFLQLGNFTPDPAAFNRRLMEWLVEYNFHRHHQALGYRTPWDFYQQTSKVLPMYPSHTRN